MSLTLTLDPDKDNKGNLAEYLSNEMMANAKSLQMGPKSWLVTASVVSSSFSTDHLSANHEEA